MTTRVSDQLQVRHSVTKKMTPGFAPDQDEEKKHTLRVSTSSHRTCGDAKPNSQSLRT